MNVAWNWWEMEKSGRAGFSAIAPFWMDTPHPRAHFMRHLLYLSVWFSEAVGSTLIFVFLFHQLLALLEASILTFIAKFVPQGWREWSQPCRQRGSWVYSGAFCKLTSFVSKLPTVILSLLELLCCSPVCLWGWMEIREELINWSLIQFHQQGMRARLGMRHVKLRRLQFVSSPM